MQSDATARYVCHTTSKACQISTAPSWKTKPSPNAAYNMRQSKVAKQGSTARRYTCQDMPHGEAPQAQADQCIVLVKAGQSKDASGCPPIIRRVPHLAHTDAAFAAFSRTARQCSRSVQQWPHSARRWSRSANRTALIVQALNMHSNKLSHTNPSNESPLRRTDTLSNTHNETRNQILRPCQKPGSRGQLNRQFSAC